MTFCSSQKVKVVEAEVLSAVSTGSGCIMQN